MRLKLSTLAAALLLANAAAAEIAPFQIDESIRSVERSRLKHISAIHETVENRSATLEGARLAILRSVTGRAGRMFFLEGEGGGYIDVRLDYKRNPMWLRVEYTEKYIQIKYLDGLKDFTCKRNIDGMCYKNHRHFYKFGSGLRKNIVRNLRILERAGRQP